jgi:TPP-dependent pyruvate/acetoin dehydrogenase alpha subunit
MVKAGPYGRDCIDVAEKQLVEHGIMSAEEIQQIRETATIEVQAAVAQAQQEPVPDPYQEVWQAWSTKEFYAENP